MALFNTANVFERLNAGVYAPLTGISKPMVEPVMDIDPSLEAGQGINVDASGVATLATDNATHIVSGSNLGLVDGTYKLIDSTNIPAVVLGQAVIDCQVKTGETIAKGDEVAFEAGLLLAATAETQKFIVEDTETVIEQGNTVILARIKFK
jgi:hypothetical protein